MTKIFGYDWEDIQRAQRGDMSGIRKTIATSNGDTWTDEDQSLLDKHGTLSGLESAGFYGTADRARRQGRAE